MTPENENRLRARALHLVSGIVLEVPLEEQEKVLEATFEAALTMLVALAPADVEVIAYRVIAKVRAAGFSASEPVQWRPLVATVADRHGLTVADLVGPARKQDVCEARHEAMHVLRHVVGEDDKPRWSLPALGRMFNRDHTSVLHGVRAHQAILDATRRDEERKSAA